MNARTNRWLIAAAIAALILGAILSRAIEPGVRVEKVMLTANTVLTIGSDLLADRTLVRIVRVIPTES